LDENPKGCLAPTKAGAAPPNARARHPPPPQGTDPAPSTPRAQWQRAPERGEFTHRKLTSARSKISLAALMFVKKGQLQALPPPPIDGGKGGRGLIVSLFKVSMGGPRAAG